MNANRKLEEASERVEIAILMIRAAKEELFRARTLLAEVKCSSTTLIATYERLVKLEESLAKANGTER